MFLLDLLGTAAIVAGGGYVAVLGSIEAVDRVGTKLRSTLRHQIGDAQDEIAPTSLGAKIALMLRDRPSEWEFGEYRATHLPTGLQLWTANGRGHIGIWRAGHGGETDVRSQFPLSWREKARIWSAYTAVSAGRKAKQRRTNNAEIHKLLDQHIGAQS